MKLIEIQKIDKLYFGCEEIDFRVKLGSIVESDTREYYATNRFSYLEQKLTSLLSNSH